MISFETQETVLRFGNICNIRYIICNTVHDAKKFYAEIT